jgi:hypothetical protein
VDLAGLGQVGGGARVGRAVLLGHGERNLSAANTMATRG